MKSKIFTALALLVEASALGKAAIHNGSAACGDAFTSQMDMSHSGIVKAEFIHVTYGHGRISRYGSTEISVSAKQTNRCASFG